MAEFVELSGKRFGRLTVIGKSSEQKATHHIFWECLCDCGETKFVRVDHLNGGFIKSCGCLKKEVNFRHGYVGTPIYKHWLSMLQRCTNPKHVSWPNYGGRGITVCPEWSIFENFLRDMPGFEPGKSLERIDVNKGYSKDNCTWIDLKLQRLNTRRSIKITINGETKVLSEWCEIFNVSYRVAYHRFKKGFSLEEVFNQPMNSAWATKLEVAS